MKEVLKLTNIVYLSFWMVVVVSLLVINLVKEGLSNFFASKRDKAQTLNRNQRTRYVITPSL